MTRPQRVQNTTTVLFNTVLDSFWTFSTGYMYNCGTLYETIACTNGNDVHVSEKVRHCILCQRLCPPLSFSSPLSPTTQYITSHKLPAALKLWTLCLLLSHNLQNNLISIFIKKKLFLFSKGMEDCVLLKCAAGANLIYSLNLKLGHFAPLNCKSITSREIFGSVWT